MNVTRLLMPIALCAAAVAVPVSCAMRIHAEIRDEVMTRHSADKIIAAVYDYRRVHEMWPDNLSALVAEGGVTQEELGDWSYVRPTAENPKDPRVLMRHGRHHVVLRYRFDLEDSQPPFENWDIREEGNRIDWRKMAGGT